MGWRSARRKSSLRHCGRIFTSQGKKKGCRHRRRTLTVEKHRISTLIVHLHITSLIRYPGQISSEVVWRRVICSYIYIYIETQTCLIYYINPIYIHTVRCARSSSLKCKSKWGTCWHPPSPSHWHWCLGFWLHFIHPLLPIAWCHWDSWVWPHFKCQSMLLLCTNLGSRPLTKKQANVLSIGNGLLCPWPLVDRWDQEWFIKAKGACNVFDRLRCQDKGKLAQQLHLKRLLSNCTHSTIYKYYINIHIIYNTNI